MKISLKICGVVLCILLASALISCGCGGDTTAPLNVSVMINNGAASALAPTVILSIAATDNIGVTGYYISETSTIPSATAPGWTPVTSTISYSADVPFILSSGDGTKTIYIWFKDDAGNVSAPATASITLDTTAPSNVSVMINNGATSTSYTTVALSIAATDNIGVTGYYISETSTIPSATAPGWTSVTSIISYSADVSFILSSGDGTKTIYVWFKDDTGNVSAPATASITLSTTISMITPYVNSTDLEPIDRAFSSSASAPWGAEHLGIDFMPNRNFVPFQAVCSGSVDYIELWQLPTTSHWLVHVRLKYNDAYSVLYAFEPMSADKSDGETQLDNIVVSEGQTVSQGDIIGYLYDPVGLGHGAHVDFGLLNEDWDRICPEPYFTSEARDSILSLIHEAHPSWDMCY